MRNAQTPAQMTARYNKGFGRGEGASYKPWLEIHQVPSHGVTTRIPGWKTQREHLAFSELEEGAILCAQQLDRVLDIREQFPLFPLVRTEQLAAELGVRHPSHPKEKCPIMMTTDILLTEQVRPGVTRLTAIAVKPSEHLEDSRTLEKLQIERLFWETQDVSWSLVTEKELPFGLIRNLRWINPMHEIQSDMLSASQIRTTEMLLLESFVSDPSLPLNVVCAQVDDRIGLRPGSALTVVRHCLSRKRWSADLRTRIDTNLPFSPTGVATDLRQAA
jgi:hypothetical protein